MSTGTYWSVRHCCFMKRLIKIAARPVACGSFREKFHHHIPVCREWQLEKG